MQIFSSFFVVFTKLRLTMNVSVMYIRMCSIGNIKQNQEIKRGEKKFTALEATEKLHSSGCILVWCGVHVCNIWCIWKGYGGSVYATYVWLSSGLSVIPRATEDCFRLVGLWSCSWCLFMMIKLKIESKWENSWWYSKFAHILDFDLAWCKIKMKNLSCKNYVLC